MSDEIAKLKADLDEARSFAENAAAKYNALLEQGPTLTCAFCGQQYEKGTPPSQHQALTDHIRKCEKHPLNEDIRKLKNENDILRGLVAKSLEQCVYCGLVDKSRCSHGFPGCAWADDLLIGESEAEKSITKRLYEYRKRIQELEKDRPHSSTAE